ncbi:MAG: hypothetical protein PHP01_04780 [Phycisphaerae bacterium]|nr:hypothetical protein [Phycisphaerae bacterium]
MKDLLLIFTVIPVFIILLVVISRTVKESLKFDGPASLILSICVSALATIGLNSHLKGNVGVILIPYATLAICMLLAGIVAFLFKFRGKAKDRSSDMPPKNPPQPSIDDRRKNQTTVNDRTRR